MTRVFQTKTIQITNDIIAGESAHRTFYGPITPGGGKSTLPLLLMRLLPTIADKVCWVVPRVTLGVQAEQVFVSARIKTLFPHTRRMRYDTNSPDPSRGTEGYITTYQAIASDPRLHRQEFSRHRYILFLDEPHHVKTHFSQPEHAEFAWAHAIQPLIDRAVLVFYASGTFARHDQKPILGIPYMPTAEGYKVDFPSEQMISYSRTEAIAEHAIVPLQFIVRDGKAIWRDRDGTLFERDSFDETSYESGQMLDSVLETDFARELLADTVTHWQGHRQQFPHGKLLVVAPKITLARRYLSWLKHDHELKAEMATSDDSAKARDAIAAFKGRRKPSLDVLVTVGMAYEGLDVPEITHIACLTRYRSKPWLEQCFARACRTMDGKAAGFVFAPDDPLLNQVVALIKHEQDAAVKDQSPLELDPNGVGAGTGTGDPLATILPLSSSATDTRAYDFHQTISREETARLALVMQQFNIHGISPLQFKRAVDAAGSVQDLPTREDMVDDVLTPSEIEQRLKEKIDEYTKTIDYTYFGGRWGTTNGEILKAGFRSETR